MDKFDVILADPPWKFKYWIAEQGKKVGSRAAEIHYPVMETEDICALPISNYCNDNSVLFLWAVWPKITEAFEVIDAWGFEYKTKAWTWIKAKRSGFGFHFGMGYYTRANDEPCLLAVKGSMPVAVHDIQGLIYSPVRKHSQKPDDQYRKIEALYPNMTYLELFARTKRKGWACWGNEIENDIRMPT